MTANLLSIGMPMLLMGDELLRTQHGNNNAYCQDNEISWMQWKQARVGMTCFDLSASLLKYPSLFVQPGTGRRQHVVAG